MLKILAPMSLACLTVFTPSTQAQTTLTQSTSDSATAAPSDETKQPGRLLTQAPAAANVLIPGAAKGVNFTYVSTNGIDGTTPITVTGALYLPEGTAPEGGWPLIAWSHGTVGVADVCAPSMAGRSQRDLTYLSNWLRKGYAIVASDYQGLGGEGMHPYMASRPMAYSNLDAIRAVQQADFPLSKAVVVVGQSQGAAGAISTAGYAPEYAPEIDLRAISATGVPFFPPAIQQMLTTPRPNTPSGQVTYALYLLILAEEINPDFAIKDAVDPKVWPAVSKVYEQCYYDLTATVKETGLTSEDISNPKIAARYDSVFAAMAYPTFQLSVPAFIGSGELDEDTPLPMQQAFVQTACAAGSAIEARQYAGAGHNGGLLNSMPDVELFVAKAFNGEALPGNCSG